MSDTRTKINIQELESRGYKMDIDHDLNENFWIKGNKRISIHTVRSSPPEYFKEILNQKDRQFEFEVICPPVKTISEDWKQVKLEVIC